MTVGVPVVTAWYDVAVARFARKTRKVGYELNIRRPSYGGAKDVDTRSGDSCRGAAAGQA